VVLDFEGLPFVEVADPQGMGVTAEGARGILTVFLDSGDLAIEPAKEVNEPGITVEVSFRVVSTGEFLEKNLGEPGGGGLEANFGQFRSVVTAEEIEQMILLETVLNGLFLGQRPFEVAAGGPIGNIAFGDTGEAVFLESGDNVFVGDGIPDHAIDHIALEARKAGDAAVAPGFA